jgi:hypothetical protein
MSEKPYYREGTAILATGGGIVYEAFCFENEDEAFRATELMNKYPDLDWDDLAEMMGIELVDQEPRS